MLNYCKTLVSVTLPNISLWSSTVKPSDSHINNTNVPILNLFYLISSWLDHTLLYTCSLLDPTQTPSGHVTQEFAWRALRAFVKEVAYMYDPNTTLYVLLPRWTTAWIKKRRRFRRSILTTLHTTRVILLQLNVTFWKCEFSKCDIQNFQNFPTHTYMLHESISYALPCTTFINTRGPYFHEWSGQLSFSCDSKEDKSFKDRFMGNNRKSNVKRTPPLLTPPPPPLLL